MYWLESAVVIAIAYLLYQSRKRKPALPLPPGPKGFPFIGNIFDIPAKFEWITYHEWAESLGTDLLYLEIMGQKIIVLDKPKAVSDLLEKRSLRYSSRPRSVLLNDIIDSTFNTTLLKYGETWRRHRRLSHSFFGPSTPMNYRPQTVRAARNLLGRLLASPTDIKSQLRLMAGDVILSTCYGLDYNSHNGPLYLEAVHKGTQAFIEAIMPGKFLVDLIPALKHVPEWMPGAGFQTKAREWKIHISDMLNLPFNAAQKNMVNGTCPSCFICTSLGTTESGTKVEAHRIVRDAAGTLYAAGADTTVTVLSSCILGLLSRPEVMRRAREELDRVIKPGYLPSFDDQPSLPFITAITKEAFRWREATPLGVPHYIEEEDEYAGYRIPAGSLVLVNTWALLHDEEFYPDPFTFKPERFMTGDHLNTEAKDPELACWGYGRRICPGRYMAFSSVWITIASLVYVFDIEKETDEHGSPIEPNPPYTSELLFAPEVVPCQIKPRSEEIARLVEAHINQD